MTQGRKPGIETLTQADPNQVGVLPQCPPHLDTEARREWERVVPLLASRGILESADRAALSAYCLCWSRHVEAEQKMVETGGAIVRGPNGGAIQNPYLSISNKSLTLMKTYLSEFGLSPVARQRLLTEAGELEDECPPPIPPGRHVFKMAFRDRGRDYFVFRCPACGHEDDAFPFSWGSTMLVYCPGCGNAARLGREAGVLCLVMEGGDAREQLLSDAS